MWSVSLEVHGEKFILSGLKGRWWPQRWLLTLWQVMATKVAADLIAQTLHVTVLYHSANAGEVGRLRFEDRIPEPWGWALSRTGPLCCLFLLSCDKRTQRVSTALYVSAEVQGMPFRSVVAAFCCRTSGIKCIPAVISLISRDYLEVDFFYSQLWPTWWVRGKAWVAAMCHFGLDDAQGLSGALQWCLWLLLAVCCQLT